VVHDRGAITSSTLIVLPQPQQRNDLIFLTAALGQSFDIIGSCIYESCAFTNVYVSVVRNHLLILSLYPSGRCRGASHCTSTRTSSDKSIEGCSREVTFHQMPCHFPSLLKISIMRITWTGKGVCSCDPAQAVKHFAPAVAALSGIFGQQDQVGDDEGPFFVAHICRVGVS
jgi:hypothetical protein